MKETTKKLVDMCLEKDSIGTDQREVYRKTIESYIERCINERGIEDVRILYDYLKEKRDLLDVTKERSQRTHLNTFIKYLDDNVFNGNNKMNKNNYLYECKEKLENSYNIILRGAPGTGKTYLAKDIAALIVSDGEKKYNELPVEIKDEQIGFVQFHPNYDYTDFVEGIKPKLDGNSMVFKYKEGVFKEFINRAKKNFENACNNKNVNTINDINNIDDNNINEIVENFIKSVDSDKEYSTKRNIFYIKEANREEIYIDIPNNESCNSLVISIEKMKKLLKNMANIKNRKDVVDILSTGNKTPQQEHSYYFALYNEIVNNIKIKGNLKKYVFIIDEINRGEISKIFGELFYSIDPGNRGIKGDITTQYSYMQSDEKMEKFYIPENVYIIGTMNDIDRSVDTFDFAMRRRFRFIEVKPEDRCDDMWFDVETNKQYDWVKKAKTRMNALNNVIVNETNNELNENYKIGPAYFLKLKKMSWDELWDESLKPLLEDYVRGLSDEQELLIKFKNAYDSRDSYNED